MITKGIRGAITVEENTVEAMKRFEEAFKPLNV